MMHAVPKEHLIFRKIFIYRSHDRSFEIMQISVIKFTINMILMYPLVALDSVDLLTNSMIITEPYAFTQQFLKDYGAAMLLSRVNGDGGGISAPYGYNKKDWYNIGGLSVGSLNLWQYKDKVNNIYGFKTYDGPKLYPYSVQFAKLSDSVSGGENSLPSTFDPGLVKYQVVIVPKE